VDHGVSGVKSRIFNASGGSSDCISRSQSIIAHYSKTEDRSHRSTVPDFDHVTI